jgi:hypothetical protein
MSNLASVLNLLGKPNEGMEVLLQSEHLLNEYPSDPGQYITLDHNFARSMRCKIFGMLLRPVTELHRKVENRESHRDWLWG